MTIEVSDEDYRQQQQARAEEGHLPWAHVAQHDAYGKGYADGLVEAAVVAEELEREKARYTLAIEALVATMVYVLKIPDPLRVTEAGDG